MKQQKNSRASVLFEKHPPERQPATGGCPRCCCGSCCCCCCLHTLGGLFAAAAVTWETESPQGRSVVWRYWMFLMVSAGAAFLLSTLARSTAGMGVFVLLLFLPVVQLVASIFTLIWVLIRREDVPGGSAKMDALVKITFGLLWGRRPEYC